MPKAYIIANITVRDPEGYKEYIRLDTPVIESFGGRFIIRGGRSEVLEGSAFERTAVIEFPDYASARAMYDSLEYQRAADIRRATAEAVLILVEGVP